MILVAIDLFGTLVPLESDFLAHRELSEAICSALKCDAKELDDLYWKVVSEVGDSSLALAKVVEELCRRLGVENPFTREELEYLHTWSHIKAAAEVGPCPGAKEFLMMVKHLGAFVGVVSDAAPGVPEGILKALGLRHLVNEVVASGECGFRKPNPKLVEALIHRLGIEPSKIVIVGDSPRDVALAKAIGATSVSIGFVEGANYVARNLFEASRIVARIVLER